LRCDGFKPEDYGLFSLGSLEETEASEIATHLDQQCETCLREIRRNLGFWSAYGAALSPSAGEVIRRDWEGVLGSPSAKTVRFAKAWPQWAAVAAGLIMVSALTGWVVSVFQVNSKRELQTQVASLEQRADRLTRERDQAIRGPNRTAPASPAPSTPTPNRGLQSENTLRQNLTASQNALDSAQRSLAGAQNEVVQLNAQLAQQQTELASLRTQQSNLEARAGIAEQSSAQTLQQMQQLRDRITQLEADRTRLVNLLQIRERQSQQNLRLVEDLAAPGTKLIPLGGTEAAPRARGYAILTADNRITFYQSGLPGLGSNRTYQIWLIRNRGVPIVSGGLFKPNGQPQTEVQLNAGNLASNLTGIAVTSEPLGGSPLPTGEKVLIGTIRRG
jgi:hypothetical protein